MAAMATYVPGSMTARALFVFSAGLLAGTVSSLRKFDLVGKNALVTGGGRGLGLEIARVLVEKGANVAIVARDDDELERALEDLQSRAPAGSLIVGVPCDLREKESIGRMLAAVRTLLGPMDVLVNNAGTIQVGPLDAMRPEDFEE